MSARVLSLTVKEPHALADVPVLSAEEFRAEALSAAAHGARIAAYFGHPLNERRVRLFLLLAQDGAGRLSLCAQDVEGRFAALTPDLPQAQLFEREIAEQWGLVPEGHPWLKPVRFHRAYLPGADAWGRLPEAKLYPGVAEFYRVEGDQIHEVAVGPVHAGVIEPGHFRFQCHGEEVQHLEIALGYQHRGVEGALLRGPTKRSLHYIETLAGDSTIAHTVAYAHALEALSGIQAPPRAHALRGIALELERLANHTGDLGALSGDVGFQSTQAFCGRIRGEWLNLTAELCGNRFGRGLVRPGGVRFELEPERAARMLERATVAFEDLDRSVSLLWDSVTSMARFEECGALSAKDAQELGLVGVAARASGIERDVRRDFATGIYRFAQIPISTFKTGDVFARAMVRWLEAQRSEQFLREQLPHLPEGALQAEHAGALVKFELPPERIVVSLVEGWRGEVCHVALTDEEGRFAHYKIVDPSFHNWSGLALAMRGQQISDFPLCNKSFNLSYCGHDL